MRRRIETASAALRYRVARWRVKHHRAKDHLCVLTVLRTSPFRMEFARGYFCATCQKTWRL